MAVDTRNKLFSLLRLHKPYTVNLPDPIVSFDQVDLQHFLNGYSGILWDIPAAGIDIDTIITSGKITRKLITSGKIDRNLLTTGIINRKLITTGTITRKLQTTGDLE